MTAVSTVGRMIRATDRNEATGFRSTGRRVVGQDYADAHHRRARHRHTLRRLDYFNEFTKLFFGLMRS